MVLATFFLDQLILYGKYHAGRLRFPHLPISGWVVDLDARLSLQVCEVCAAHISLSLDLLGVWCPRNLIMTIRPNVKHASHR